MLNPNNKYLQRCESIGKEGHLIQNLKTIDGATLMTQPFAFLPFVVETLLSQGLHILTGSPKVGKSWLALWLAVSVARGEPVWGKPVK